MTSIAAIRKRFGSLLGEPIPGAPEGALGATPYTVEEAGRIMQVASASRLPVVYWGGGTHQGFGSPRPPVLVVSTSRFQSMDWRPDDLTVTVESGVRVSDLEERLAEGGQTAVLTEQPDNATVGGAIAAGISGYRRLRYGPTRDRVLGVTLVTGDGRIVHGGGTVVKNVSGYDLSRLTVGSFGRMGFIAEVSLKLWPLPQATATVFGVRPEDAVSIYRPMAVLEADGEGSVVLGGHPKMVEAQIEELGGEVVQEEVWPKPLRSAIRCVIRVPARFTRQAVDRVPEGWSYRAAFGVGEVRIGSDEPGTHALTTVRTWAESVGGRLVVEHAPDDLAFDPWGTPPATSALQRRLIAGFDPAGISNAGRLPGEV